MNRVWREHLLDWLSGPEDAARARARRRLATLRFPPRALTVLQTLAGCGGRALLVGGTVRDALLGREGGVPDVATDRTPEEMRTCFATAAATDVSPLAGARVVPTGIEHGTLTVLLSGEAVECTTFREEDTYSDARRPDRVVFTRDPLSDLDRRDLTVNAMAFDPVSGELLDPHGGARDLERRRLRAVGEPLARFREDALRPLRVARLAAVLGMAPDAELHRALRRITDPDSGVRLSAVAMERVHDELTRLMTAAQPSVGFELMAESGMLAVWMPELDQCRGVTQNRFHAYDVFTHSLRTCDAAPVEKPRVRWAALLHDLGKPGTRVMRRGDATFYGHAELGATLADRLLERLRFPTDERRAIVHLVREHMFDFHDDWSDAALRRWLGRVGPETVADLFDLRLADAIGNGRRGGFPTQLERMRQRIQTLLEGAHPLGVRDLAVDGRDVMRVLGLAPGPEVGAVLARLLDEVIEHPGSNTRVVLLARLESWRVTRA
ncbi:MAG: CCA tRNA nucleotidyltransferase [Candidatus Eisenbacteria bacterium]